MGGVETVEEKERRPKCGCEKKKEGWRVGGKPPTPPLFFLF